MVRIRRCKPCKAVVGCMIGFVTALANRLAAPGEDEAVVTTIGRDRIPAINVAHKAEGSAWLISNLPERLARKSL